MPRDTAHENLVEDLKKILADAEGFEFHDFKNTKYAVPKMALVAELEKVSARAKNGWYDNKE